jgi:hypothetical protein
MGWTTPTDHSETVVTQSEWNALMGASGNFQYLKEAADAPVRAQKDAGTVVGGRQKVNFKTGSFNAVTVADNVAGDAIDVTIDALGMKAQKDAGTILGGRSKINFIQGANIALTVADNSGDDRIDVTVAASGSSIPTQSYSSNRLTLSSHNTWVQAIASSGFAAIHLLLSCMPGSNSASRSYVIDIGTGSAGSESSIISGLLIANANNSWVPIVTTFSIPFSIAQSTRIAIRYRESDSNNDTIYASLNILG